MSFMQRLSATTTRHMDSLKALHARRVAEAEARARRKIAEARTKTEKERAKLVLEREKLALRQELYEAQTATRKAKDAVKKARLEAGDLTVGERLGIVGRQVSKQAGQAYKVLEKQSRKQARPTRKRVVRKSTVAKRTVASKKKSVARK